jgi:hypothetical protein
MDTMNQHPDKDYDIDTGVIVDAGALPVSALESRKRVAEALQQAAGTFATEPEARTNAVTVWYAEGHHVDVAVYRRTDSGALEHAGADWRREGNDSGIGDARLSARRSRYGEGAVVFESFGENSATFPRKRHTSALNACSKRRSCQA